MNKTKYKYNMRDYVCFIDKENHQLVWGQIDQITLRFDVTYDIREGLDNISGKIFRKINEDFIFEDRKSCYEYINKHIEDFFPVKES